MNDPAANMAIGFCVLFALGVVVWLIYQYNANQKRVQDLFATAMGMGLEFSALDIANIPDKYHHCDWFTRGYNRWAYNLMYGKMDAYDVKCFDYRYETGSGKSHQVHHMSFVIFDTDAFFPSLLIRPEHLADRLAGALGFEDIDFESEGFSRKFFVKSRDKKFAYDVVHPRTMQLLMENPEWSIELAGRSAIITDGRLLRADQVGQAVLFAREFLGLFPDYLNRQLRGQEEAK